MSLVSNLAATTLVAGALGPVSHYLFWSRQELETRSHIVALVFLGFPACTSAFLSFKNFSIKEAVLSAIVAEFCYVASLLLSITIYRLYLHPLCKFPGPTWAKVTQFWRMRAMTDNESRGYLTIHKLHQTYGDIVRVGPRVLSINHVDALQGIYGSSSPCMRLSSLEAMRKNLQSLRDKDEHRARRHVWEQGLNAKVCHEYLPRINQTISVLLSQLFVPTINEASQPQILNRPIRFFVFDIISEIGFGRSYSQLTTQTPFPAIAKVDKFLSVGIIAIQVLWLLNILTRIPGLQDPGDDMRQWAYGVLEDREEEEKKKIQESTKEITSRQDKDVLSFIFHDEAKLKIRGNDARWPLTRKDIAEDAVTLQIAGSDTSYSLIMHLLFYLSKQPAIQQKIRHEALAALPAQPTSNLISDPNHYPHYTRISSPSTSPYLDAAIQETLRLHPPVPQGLNRITPQNTPIMIAGHVIPRDTIVTAPVWTIQRDSRYWERPEEWIPERWIEGCPERETLVKDRRAFAPFSLGSMNCVGRFFAIMEVKMLIARLVLVAELRPELCPDNVSFAALVEADADTRLSVNGLAGTDKPTWMHEQDLKDQAWLDGSRDYFTMWVPDLKLKLKRIDYGVGS